MKINDKIVEKKVKSFQRNILKKTGQINTIPIHIQVKNKQSNQLKSVIQHKNKYLYITYLDLNLSYKCQRQNRKQNV
ncbi:unnamed protein product [Paramecium sonneborni]|uniref:Uncharacterized protein n=1 Tax=Paramecium sonneborni TaxID=65129 RepID=A0A8S1RTL3_9CILI|nr:unnamed protein product [Paramecium sonneborni]